MHSDGIFEMLENIETEILNLYREKKILKSTLDMVRHWIGDIRRVLTDITESTYEKEVLIGSLSHKLEVLNSLMKAIKHENEDDARALTKEILNIITESHSIDIFLVESSFHPSPLVTYHHRGDDELTFFLLFPSSEYLSTDRIGLVAHEASHTNEIVERYAESLKSEKRKIGESLADILGLYVAGPLFAQSLSFIILNDIGLDRLSEIYDYHPSWIARVTVLHHVNSNMWETTIFEKVVHELLGKVFHSGLPQPSEDLLIAKCMREYDRYAKEFLRVRIDEMRIVNFNKVESDSILYRLNSQYVR